MIGESLRTPNAIHISGPDSPLVVVDYRGFLVRLTYARLVELLDAEQSLLRNGDALPVPASPPPVAPPTVSPTSGDLDTRRFASRGARKIGHASLSNRIKRIYGQSQRAKAIRPTHEGILTEVLTSFDWHFPAYKNEQIPKMLGEMSQWRDISPQLREQIAHFLKRYVAGGD